jgi:hypothetical protein
MHRLTGMPHQPKHAALGDAIPSSELGSSCPGRVHGYQTLVNLRLQALGDPTFSAAATAPILTSWRSFAVYTSGAGFNLNPLRPTTTRLTSTVRARRVIRQAGHQLGTPRAAAASPEWHPTGLRIDLQRHCRVSMPQHLIALGRTSRSTSNAAQVRRAMYRQPMHSCSLAAPLRIGVQGAGPRRRALAAREHELRPSLHMAPHHSSIRTGLGLSHMTQRQRRTDDVWHRLGSTCGHLHAILPR